MRRCEHEVYLPSWVPDGKPNPYCSGCPNFGKVNGERTPHLPQRYINNDQLHAQYQGCPKCHATEWYRVNENGGDEHRECSECGTRYKVKAQFAAAIFMGAQCSVAA
jgi:hypothetical protein